MDDTTTITDPDVQAVVDELSRRNMPVASNLAFRRVIPVRWLLPWLWIKAKDRQTGRRTQTGITTGYKALDTKLRGGWQDSTLYTVMGLPKAGKTSVLVNFLRNAIEAGATVMMAEAEVPAGDIVEKLAGIESGVSPSAVSLGGYYDDEGDLIRYLSEEEWEDWFKALKKVSSWPLYPIEGQISASDIKEEYKALLRKARNPPNLLLVDYLQKLKGSSSQDNFASVTASSNAMRQFSLEYELPIIQACQPNRTVHDSADKRLQPHHAGGSGSIEADSVVMLGLNRKGMMLDVADRPEVDDLEIDIMLNRNGPVGRVYTKMHMPTGFVYPAPKEKDTDL